MITVIQDLVLKLPPSIDTLYIQVDGCNDNVNQTVMCYLELLVSGGRFKEIQFHRLPVGHTHEDIGELNLFITNHN